MTGRDWTVQLVGFLALSTLFFLGLYLVNTAESISGPRIKGANAQGPQCLGARIEHVEDLTQGVQRVERVRLVIFCTTDRYYQLVRAWAMRTDGVIGQPFSNEREMVCEQPRPAPENKAVADVLREGR